MGRSDPKSLSDNVCERAFPWERGPPARTRSGRDACAPRETAFSNKLLRCPSGENALTRPGDETPEHRLTAVLARGEALFVRGMDLRPQRQTMNAQRVPMKTLTKESLQFRMVELCPEIQELGLYYVVIGRGNRY